MFGVSITRLVHVSTKSFIARRLDTLDKLSYFHIGIGASCAHLPLPTNADQDNEKQSPRLQTVAAQRQFANEIYIF